MSRIGTPIGIIPSRPALDGQALVWDQASESYVPGTITDQASLIGGNQFTGNQVVDGEITATKSIVGGTEVLPFMTLKQQSTP